MSPQHLKGRKQVRSRQSVISSRGLTHSAPPARKCCSCGGNLGRDEIGQPLASSQPKPAESSAVPAANETQHVGVEVQSAWPHFLKLLPLVAPRLQCVLALIPGPELSTDDFPRGSPGDLGDRYKSRRNLVAA